MGEHIVDGEFQSDKYPLTPRGKILLSLRDKLAQPFLWGLAQAYRVVDCALSDDLETCLRKEGYAPPGPPPPIPLILWCPSCETRHVDAGDSATRPHRTHACQHCGVLWAPAAVPTVGVQFLPGCKDEAPATDVRPRPVAPHEGDCNVWCETGQCYEVTNGPAGMSP